MIDLGLAVEAPQWMKNWRTSEMGGDPRYWSPAHWQILFGQGTIMEKQNPDYARLYQERIDHYALGVLLLELVFGAWSGPSDEAAAAAKGTNNSLERMSKARQAWLSYWSHAMTLFQIFVKGKTNLELVYKQVRANKLDTGIAEAHDKLVTALRKAVDAEVKGVEDGNPSAGGLRVGAPLLLAAAELVDPAGRLSWDGAADLLRGEGFFFFFLATTAPREEGIPKQPLSRSASVMDTVGGTE